MNRRIVALFGALCLVVVFVAGEARSAQKPNSNQLLEMYDQLDSRVKEIKEQMKLGVLAPYC